MRTLIIFLIFLSSISMAADMLDVDYQFIDNAFNHTRAVSDKDFDDAIKKKTPGPQPEGAKEKIKTFLFGRKSQYEYEKAHPEAKQKTQTDVEKDSFDEAQIIKNMKNGIYYIKLLASIISADGKVIQAGNYKIQQKTINNQNMLVFYQGNKEYGMLRLKKFEDNLKGKYDITYSRVDIISDDIIRIVYSTLDDTQCAIAKVYNQSSF